MGKHALNLRVCTGRLLCLERAGFKERLGDLSQLRHMWRFEALRRVPLLASVSSELKAKLCAMLKQQSYPAKADIVLQGSSGQKFYIVESGMLAVIRDGKAVMRLLPGQVSPRMFRSVATIAMFSEEPMWDRHP